MQRKLWTLYGKNDAVPPFDPDTIKELSISTSASKLFDIIVTAMSSHEKSPSRKHQNEKKVGLVNQKKPTGFRRSLHNIKLARVLAILVCQF